MKKVWIIIILTILWIWLWYIAYKTSYLDGKIQNVNEPSQNIISGNIQKSISETDNISWKNTLWSDSSEKIILMSIKGFRDKMTDCEEKIWNINSLETEISSKTWSIIEKMNIKNECWEIQEYSYSITMLSGREYEYLKQENDKYIVYSLVDKEENRNKYYMEYPIIIYDKIQGTNSLLTIRNRIPALLYLDNEWNLIIEENIYMNESATYSVYVVNIKKRQILWDFTYNSEPQDWSTECWTKSIKINTMNNSIINKSVIFHAFDENLCWEDYCSVYRCNENEKTKVWQLTYQDKILWKFSKTSKLFSTNEDIMESIKNNTFIFHIDNNKYELNNDILIQKN